MVIFELDAKLLSAMFCAGVQELEANKDWINELNVFPVPDGDTGTNMTLTLLSAVNEVKNLKEPTLSTLGKAISSGSLRGARGNSGVILSQLCRGFTKVLKDAEVLNGEVLVKALNAATETAYKAVMKPKEGTILTVARGISEKAAELAEEQLDLTETLRLLIEHGDAVLENTPELLPVLKEAGVVDSGGQGLMVFIKGMYAVMTGEKTFDMEAEAAKGKEKAAGSGPKAVSAERTAYSVEFTIKGAGLTEEDETDLKTYLAGIGENVMVLSLNDTVKARVNTNDPGLAIQRGVEYGTLSKIKINALEETIKTPARTEEPKAEKPAEKPAPAPEKVEPAPAAPVLPKAEEPKPEPRKQYGFVTVTSGDGLTEIFKAMGADGVIMGGQTMNPSAEAFVGEIEKINADIIYILPNNKNIIMAAELAQYMVADKKVVVIPTKTIPQGISALIYFDPGLSEEENTENMKNGIAAVRTGQITYAIRDTVIDGKVIEQNDIISIGDHSALLAVGKDTFSVARETVNALVSDEAGAISIYYGSSVSPEEAEKLGETVEADYPNCDVEVQNGGQPIYYYIISVE
ncbi:MAG: DAK2 domain-containing protein [Lachnospiraceae bacterium]|nr:DAK2 domain-containing protein [Lachnospiraceae bacterium]